MTVREKAIWRKQNHYSCFKGGSGRVVTTVYTTFKIITRSAKKMSEQCLLRCYEFTNLGGGGGCL